MAYLATAGPFRRRVCEPVNKHLPAAHKLDEATEMPRTVANYKIVFGIISQSDEAELHIPFFARVALKNLCRRPESIGYTDIRLAKISVDDDCKHLISLRKAMERKLV